MLLYLYYDTTTMKNTQAIKKEIDNIKKTLMALDRIRPGSLTTQKRARGTKYHQLSYSYNGKGHTEYVRKKDVPAVRKELENYQKFRKLITTWVGLEIKLARKKYSRNKK